MSVLVDSRPHAVAIKAALKPQLGEWSAWDYDDLPGSNGNPGTPPRIFTLVSLERRTSSVLRTPGRAGAVGWRLAIRSVGHTIDECRWAQLKAAAALNEQRLLVGGEYSSRLQYESGDAPAYDDGRYSALDFYTYVR